MFLRGHARVVGCESLWGTLLLRDMLGMRTEVLGFLASGVVEERGHSF